MNNITKPKNNTQLHDQFSERGITIRDDDQDWGSAGMNDIQSDSNQINQ